MTKPTNQQEPAAEAANLTATNGSNMPATSTAFMSNPEDVFKALEAEHGEPWRDLSSEYMKLEPGETLDIITTGQSIRDLSGDGGENRVIEAIDRTGRSIIIGDAVIVSALWDKPAKTPYRLICTGKQKGDKGTYKTFKVLTW